MLKTLVGTMGLVLATSAVAAPIGEVISYIEAGDNERAREVAGDAYIENPNEETALWAMLVMMGQNDFERLQDAHQNRDIFELMTSGTREELARVHQAAPALYELYSAAGEANSLVVPASVIWTGGNVASWDAAWLKEQLIEGMRAEEAHLGMMANELHEMGVIQLSPQEARIAEALEGQARLEMEELYIPLSLIGAARDGSPYALSEVISTFQVGGSFEDVLVWTEVARIHGAELPQVDTPDLRLSYNDRVVLESRAEACIESELNDDYWPCPVEVFKEIDE